MWTVPGRDPQQVGSLRRWISRFSQTASAIDLRKAYVQATTPPRPQRSWTVIRDALRKRHHLTKRPRVPIHRADDTPVAFKATGLAPRVSPFGLVTVAACRTLALRVAMPAGCTTLIPGDAWAMRPTRHDTVLFGLLLQVIDVLGRTPAGSGAGCGDGRSGGGARRLGCRQKKGLDAAFLTEIPHLAGALVA